MKALLVLTTMIVSLFGFAGGGGSSSGGGGGSSYSGGGGSSYSGGGGSSYDGGGEGSSSGNAGLGDFVLMFALLAACATLVGIGKYEKRKGLGYLEYAMDWNRTKQEKWIHYEAKLIFEQYQQDWSNYNLKNIREYTTSDYYQHAILMLKAIDTMNRRNIVRDLAIIKTVLSTPVDDQTALPMTVRLTFVFNGTDRLEAIDTKSLIYSNSARGAMESWDFIYDGKSLKLNGITQSTESTPHLVESIAKFAKASNLFYSPDWGRLALPTEGLIFNNRDLLARADVNNHVVGEWGNCLVQIYTYSATPGSPNSYYIVGQINVPKSYKGVIVEAKKSKLRIKKPKGYDKFEMELEDFNRRYNVFATDADALSAFELLNPAFIDKMYKRNLPYNLEVKGNVIYAFAKVTEANIESYAELLNLLSEAFRELKM